MDENGWYLDRLLMYDEAFYGGITILHANTIYKDYSRLIDPSSVLVYYFIPSLTDSETFQKKILLNLPKQWKRCYIT